jgi:hypothetical protein
VRQHKTKLTIIGFIMVLSIPIIMHFAYIRLFNNDSSFYLQSVIAIIILAFVGFILISLSYNWTLGAGAVLLAFGIDSIMASSFNDTSISQFTKVGYLFVGIGILLILVNIYSFLRRRSAKERKYYFFPRY